MQLSSKASFGKAVAVRPAAPRARVQVARCRTVQVQAKYGEDSKYFDLKDLENTTGSWDMYGQDDKKRYPDLQATFFNKATEIISRRAALRAFITLGGIGGLVAWGGVGSKLAELPITKGSLTGGENGKGGSVRTRL